MLVNVILILSIHNMHQWTEHEIWYVLSYLWTHEYYNKTSLTKKLLKAHIKCANEQSVDRFPCSGFSYQYMNYIVEFFLFLKCWTDWYKKQSTKSKIYACVITCQISQSLSKTLANFAILCFQKQISNWTHSIVNVGHVITLKFSKYLCRNKAVLKLQ